MRAVVLAAVGLTSCFTPCLYDEKPARCVLEGVEFGEPHTGSMTRDVVNAYATYRVTGPHGSATIRAEVYYRMPEGSSREAVEASLRRYFERYPDLPCKWGKITSGTCAPNEFNMPLPGCTDQRSLTCYELAKSELAR